MNTIVQADRVHVLRQLRDLRGWARFIHESLSADQPFETGKRHLLEAYLGEPFLREFDADARSLADRLDVMIGRIEASAAPAERASLPTR